MAYSNHRNAFSNRWIDRLPAGLRGWLLLGTEGFAPGDLPGLMLANFTGVIAACSSLSFAVIYAMHDLVTLLPVVMGNLLSAGLTVCVPFVHRFGRSAGAIYLTVVIYSTIFYFIYVLGHDSGVQLNYIGAGVVGLVILGLERWRLALLIMLAGIGLHLIAWFWFEIETTKRPLAQSLIDQTYITSAVSITLILFAVVVYTLSLARQAQDQSDQLLENMMPASIADRLKANPGQPIAERFSSASVLFADLCGFTRLSQQLGPVAIVEMLDKLYSRFDALALDHGVEKIKTIGDAYMAVCGLPEENPHHADQTVKMAQAMRQETADFARQNDLDMNLRIGIASGVVTAGVIGKSKFTYDIWGDTVNLAARLEQNCHPGEILICGKTRQGLAKPGDAVLKAQGKIELRGFGAVPCWQVVAAD